MHARIATVTRPGDGIPEAGDVVELRLDSIWNGAPSEDDATRIITAMAESKHPVLATLRPERQGGAYEGPEEVRLGLLLAAVKAGTHAIDLENEGPHTAPLVKEAHDAGAHVVLSDHRFQEAPSREEGLRRLQSMQDQGAFLHKLAFPAGSFMDTLRALELAHAHAHRNGRPAIAPIGASAAVRALLPLAGNCATYGHADGHAPALAGQPSLAAIQRVWDHWGIANADLPGDPETGWLAVIGDPVDHSLSPRIHNAALAAAGKRRHYGALQVPDSIGAVRLLASVAGRIGLRGGSVTAPLKEHMAAVAEGDEWVQETGAANCFSTTAGGLQATNTDAKGLYAMLEDARGDAMVIGAGGAARAAIVAAKRRGLNVAFTTRDPERAGRVAAHHGASYVPWEDRDAARADVWIQAATVPLGQSVIAPRALDGSSLAIELVYGDAPSRFEAAAAEAGARVQGGRVLLLEQAVHAFAFWTGEAPDRAAMHEALQ